MRQPRRSDPGGDGHPALRRGRTADAGTLPVPRGVREQPHQRAQLQNIYPGDGPLRGHHRLRGHPRLPAHLVVHPPEGRTHALSGTYAPYPPLDGPERVLLRDRRPRRVHPRTGRSARRAHARSGGAEPPHRAHQGAHERAPRHLRRTGLRRQDGAARHPSAALQRPVHAGRHGRLLLRGAGPLDGLHRPLLHRTLLQGLLSGPAPADEPRRAQQERPAGEDVRHFSGVPVMGPDHGRPHRGRRQFEGARGRRRRHDKTRRSVPRTQIRMGRRHHLRRQPLARRAHRAYLRSFVERQDHLGQAAGHPAGRAGAETGADLARRLLRGPRKDPEGRRRRV